MTNLDEYQLLVEKDELFQRLKKVRRAFEMATESMLINYISDPEERKQVAGEMRDYYLKKAELEVAQ